MVVVQVCGNDMISRYSGPWEILCRLPFRDLHVSLSEVQPQDEQAWVKGLGLKGLYDFYGP